MPYHDFELKKSIALLQEHGCISKSFLQRKLKCSPEKAKELLERVVANDPKVCIGKGNIYLEKYFSYYRTAKRASRWKDITKANCKRMDLYMNRAQFKELFPRGGIWTSLRNRYPQIENLIYLVRDCEYNVLGNAFYNGFDFVNIQWDDPKKDPMMEHRYKVTHWGEKKPG